MKAMILAAGFGERLRPLTDFLPKPIAPVLNKPLISYSLNLLKKHGIKEVMINVHHLGDKIIEQLGSGEEYGIKILYSEENEILGTGGGIKKVEEYLDTDNFVIINSDTIIDLDLGNLMKFHKEQESMATMVLRKDKDADKFGAFGINDNNEIIRIQDLGDRKSSGYMFTGIHIISKQAFSYLAKDKKFCIIESFYKKAFIENKKITAFVYNGFWSDLGTINRYFNANMHLLAKKWQEEKQKGVFSGRFVEGEDVVFTPPVLIGEDAIIEDGSKIGPNVIIGKEVNIKKSAKIRDAIIWDGAYISEKEKIKNRIVTPYSIVKVQ